MITDVRTSSTTNDRGDCRVYDDVALPSGSRSIRLLDLSRDEEGNLAGTLHIHDLDNASEQWTALSYTWQLAKRDPDRDQVHSVMINGQPLVIQHNLWLALNCLIEKKEQSLAGVAHEAVSAKVGKSSFITTSFGIAPDDLKYLWVDAICIDQSRVLERNHQVALMRHIYSRARRVISWLTPDSTISESTAEQIKYELLGRISCTCSVGQSHHTIDHRDDCPCATATKRSHRENIRFNMYWQRMWIVQEVALATQVVFLYQGVWILLDWIKHFYFSHEYGSGNPAFDAIVEDRLINEYWQPKVEIPTALSGSDKDDRQGGIKPRPRWKGSSWMMSAIKRYHDQECSDCRDRVYGLLGLDTLDYPIQPDYTKSSLQLFLDISSLEADWLLSCRANTSRNDVARNLYKWLVAPSQRRYPHSWLPSGGPRADYPDPSFQEPKFSDSEGEMRIRSVIHTAHDFNDIRYLANALDLSIDNLIVHGIIAFFEDAHRQRRRKDIENRAKLAGSLRKHRRRSKLPSMPPLKRPAPRISQEPEYSLEAPQTPAQVIHWFATTQRGHEELNALFPQKRVFPDCMGDITLDSVLLFCENANYSIAAIRDHLKSIIDAG